ncbi:MAG: nicotinate-nucleotide adenylyltransferase [Gammaproteobacteria bacterium]|nr:nicotinate-nucleotide adenylyltransferase [Gammaproteobacteria bacterium]
MIGILGGTFDPIHRGHLHIATRVSAQLDLQQLQLMPCALPVHRDQPHASPEHRCAMIGLAIEGDSILALNTLELDRKGPSYSVDSLREIRHTTDASLALVLGADAFNGFAGWKSPREILGLVHLVVCCRPGFEVEQGLYTEQRVDSVAELSSQSAGCILLLQVDAIDCSSSAVRAALHAGNTPRQYLAPPVADYIDQHNLYRKPGD